MLEILEMLKALGRWRFVHHANAVGHTALAAVFGADGHMGLALAFGCFATLSTILAGIRDEIAADHAWWC